MLKQPNSVVKMTNVAFIKYRINNRYFEVACYRNKAVNWRNGLEKDIGEVLQSNEIFENANHGTLAKKADLNKFFPNKTKDEIIEIILEKGMSGIYAGQLQISDKERDLQITNMQADIATIIAEKCVHPTNSRHFTLESIKAAMKEIHYPVKLDQPAKRQALECIKLLQKRYKLIRAFMKIRISFPKVAQEDIQKRLEDIEIDHFEGEEIKEKEISRVYLIEPAKYRQINTICKKVPGISVEVLVNVVSNTEVKDVKTMLIQLEDQSAPLELLDEFKHEQEQKDEEVPKESEPKLEKQSQCTSCKQAVFATREDQRAHFKCEWHVDNVKRKSKGLPTLTEEQWKIEKFNQNYK